jgi:hypothetical protein
LSVPKILLSPGLDWFTQIAGSSAASPECGTGAVSTTGLTDPEEGIDVAATAGPVRASPLLTPRTRPGTSVADSQRRTAEEDIELDGIYLFRLLSGALEPMTDFHLSGPGRD